VGRGIAPRPARPLITAVVVLTIIAVAATAWVTIREFQVQRTVFAGILANKLKTTQSQFRGYLEPFGSHLATLQQWQEAG
jgi:hypothetical protein